MLLVRMQICISHFPFSLLMSFYNLLTSLFLLFFFTFNFSLYSPIFPVSLAYSLCACFSSVVSSLVWCYTIFAFPVTECIDRLYNPTNSWQAVCHPWLKQLPSTVFFLSFTEVMKTCVLYRLFRFWSYWGDNNINKNCSKVPYRYLSKHTPNCS